VFSSLRNPVFILAILLVYIDLDFFGENDSSLIRHTNTDDIGKESSCISHHSLETNFPCVVASLSTMPRRVDLLRPVLESLLAQRPAGIVASIELNIPYFNIRTRQNYSIPEWLNANSSSLFGERIRIFRTPDYGAITKVAPTLLRHASSKGVYIWSVDDDTVYDRDSLSNLLENELVAVQFADLHGIFGPTKHVSRHFADTVAPSPTVNTFQSLPLLRDSIGEQGRFLLIYSGFDILGENGRIVSSFGTCSSLTFAQVFRGFRGALYPPRLLIDIEQEFKKYIELTSSNPDCRVSDDVVMSNFLEARGVARFVVESGTIRDLKLQHDMDRDATHSQTGGHGKRYGRVIEWLREEKLLSLGARKSTTCT